MEILKENMLVMLTIVMVFAFIIIWSKVYDGVFQRAFCFYRKKSFQYELKLMGIVTLSLTFLNLFLYWFIEKIMGYEKMLSFGKIFFVVMMMFMAYFSIASGVLQKNIKWVSGVLMLFTSSQVLVLLAIATKRFSLDAYCGGISMILLVLNVLLGVSHIRYWKRGDL